MSTSAPNAADRPDRDVVPAIAYHPEQGWSLLCNGVILAFPGWPARNSGRVRRTLPLTAVLTGLALAGVGLTVAGCGGSGAPAAGAPPASSHTAAEQAAVMNWLAKTNQM